MPQTKIISIIAIFSYFLILLFIVTRKHKSKTVFDFFFAGRTLPYWALSITFIASWWGAGSAISTADLAYSDGIGAYWYYGMPVLVSTFILIFFSKYIRKIGFMTQGSMFEARYSKLTAKIFSGFIFLFMTITAASQMVAVGELFSAYIGWSYQSSVIIGTLVVLIYSVFGGFRGVVLTDIIQFILLVISSIIIFVVAYTNSGGWDAIINVSKQKNLTDYTNIIAGGGKYFVYVITFGCAWVIQANVWQRISATKSVKEARKMTIMSFFIYIPLYLIVVLTGMSALALYDQVPQGGVVPAIINDYLHPIVAVIVFVGLSAAIMSTMDSLINTGAMAVAVDILKNKNEKKQLRDSRLSIIVIIIIGLIIAIKIRSILEISWIASDIITTGLFVPLLAGFFWKRGNANGAMASMVSGIIYCSWNLLVRLGVKLPIFWEQESAMQVLIGVSISIIMYTSVSLMTSPQYDKYDRFAKKLKA